ncbi:hypothetical protein ACFOU2_21050 [Bacillus songklensis]|uniref:Uncharacterized protein n=1 Tax=Bacillus songklensis TaxID=1069116 RepID=A0ABV8B690_9BACI
MLKRNLIACMGIFILICFQAAFRLVKPADFLDTSSFPAIIMATVLTLYFLFGFIGWYKEELGGTGIERSKMKKIRIFAVISADLAAGSFIVMTMWLNSVPIALIFLFEILMIGITLFLANKIYIHSQRLNPEKKK